MLVKRKSIITGEDHEMDIPMTDDQILRFNEGIELIQDIFPELTPDQREFILNGITKEEWDDLYKED